ncbi:hypothetical protein [Streptomyces acidicola]|uniref:hypothetical protein n=1 Tax=Streptomyces acidicola TaxID=2596892 RepID=UPI003436F1E7
MVLKHAKRNSHPDCGARGPGRRHESGAFRSPGGEQGILVGRQVLSNEIGRQDVVDEGGGKIG